MRNAIKQHIRAAAFGLIVSSWLWIPVIRGGLGW